MTAHVMGAGVLGGHRTFGPYTPHEIDINASRLALSLRSPRGTPRYETVSTGFARRSRFFYVPAARGVFNSPACHSAAIRLRGAGSGSPALTESDRSLDAAS
jgi:hypothetical protein